ncbi:MAG TPA: hypothetical protein VLX61_02265 [Anaerolineales bacterium]|nr:hypothetical protein [Anaerolineales bacterium]
MKIHVLFLVSLSAVLLALAMAGISINSVSAKTCIDPKTKKPIPCPKPSRTNVSATIMTTSAPQPTDTPAVTPTPSAGQLALMRTSAGFIPNNGNPTGSTGQSNSDPAAPGPIPSTGTFLVFGLRCSPF